MSGEHGRRSALRLGVASMATFASELLGCGRAKSALPAARLSIPTGTTPLALNWSNDGKYLAASTDSGLRLSVFDASGHVVSSLSRPDSMALSHWIAFLKAPDQVLFGAPGAIADRIGLSVFGMAAGRPIGGFAGDGLDNPFALSGDGRTIVLATAGHPYITVFSTDGARLLHSIRLPTYDLVRSLAWLKDPVSFIAGTVGGSIYLGDAAKGELRLLANPFLIMVGGRTATAQISALAVSPDSRRAVFMGRPPDPANINLGEMRDGNAQSAAQIIDLHSGRVTAKFDGWIAIHGFYGLAWEPHGDTIVIVDGDGTLFLWNASNNAGKVAAPPGSFPGAAIAYSPDGSLLALSAQRSIEIFATNQLPRI